MKKAEWRSFTDDELLRRLSESLKQSRWVEADVIALIAEVDQRRLYAREASPSMFAWCTDVLHLSEHETFLRITVARASREHPMLLKLLRDGRLHLNGIAKLAPHLTLENRETLLKRATHKTKRQIEELIAELAPRPEVPTAMRKLPDRRAKTPPASSRGLGLDRVPAAAAHSPARPATLEPLAPALYRIQFTASAELRDKLGRLQALMRSSVPDGDLAKIIEVAVTEKLERLESKRFGKTKAPRKALAGTTTTPSAGAVSTA